jgi:hypothetical protein
MSNKSGFIPRSRGRTVSREKRLSGDEGGTEIVGGAASAQRKEIGAVVGAITRHRAIGLQQVGEELGGPTDARVRGGSC